MLEESRRLTECRQAAIDFVQPLKSKVDVETFRLEGERIESLYRHTLAVLKQAEVDEETAPSNASPSGAAQNDEILEETASLGMTTSEEESMNDAQPDVKV
ncbi:hypothetical protein Pmar_PMAR010479 [Perkinsus marinus ATCC 50983]|uniref:Uncharacterized protein n=1 Tax=Perkinsus marinus (strain ATCC 50983 / TXsc) TaxID=423536 RepID=C5KIK5_PERM5|nr:hypothetical protein Pmar_PMAR010479 [Perkinsus marinus ATCC 50983]EER15688.1 hypothetical protein Pmar_PMAR010479 [Perkinsus marinus ATCC 50983]|eukprot:XP_002783892.1 hypothetical protein Pmar_PMAR010479 [Perkinsus marinus ATCC 50983]